MTCSPARIAANRANALKSTGPKTDEGKAVSRANALKHGLTGDGVVLPTEDAQALDARLAALVDDLRPDGEAARLLVRRLALLSVRLDRSARQEAAAAAARVAGAGAAFDDARMAEAEGLLQNIHMSPATNHRRLMATPEGVDLLIRAWQELRVELEHPTEIRWTYEHYHRADYLLGRDVGNVSTTFYQAWTHALFGRFELLKPERLEGMDEEARKVHALEKLTELVDADLARLREHRAAMDTTGVEAARAKAPEVALFDPSKEAALARRYEAATERGMFRILEELRRIRREAKAAAVAAVVAAPSPAPGPRAAVPLASLFPSDPAPPPAAPRPAPAPVLPSNDLAITVGRPAKRRE